MFNSNECLKLMPSYPVYILIKLIKLFIFIAIKKNMNSKQIFIFFRQHVNYQLSDNNFK